ncbi:MAG: 30S ribosomal protein S4 [Dehalococcoidia bacterium]|nr:30S ribosomal protein S4 [Dehalococcoidia bacterium]MDD5494200.1 30S ribosomal protein S4 [Dehalococcoidia bacterium]
MARYTEAYCRLCRRTATKLMLKGERCFTEKCALERRNIPPGFHSTGKRRSKMSDRGLQLMEKQKARYTYGLYERQFRRFFEEATRMQGITGENLLILLERRLDNVIFRLGFADSRSQARQILRHGHFKLNGRKTDIPSCLVKASDVIEWRKESTKSEYYKTLVERIEDKDVPAWLSLDKGNMVGKVLNLPSREDIRTNFDEKAIVEYYSR